MHPPAINLQVRTAEAPILTPSYRPSSSHTHLGTPSPLCLHPHPPAPRLPGLVPRPQLWLILPGTMTFAELVDRVGSKGPFQLLHTVLLGLPILGMANHNLLQIFTAPTPAHHCRPPPNASAGPWVLPTGLNGKPETCLRFVYPPNASLPNDTRGATEPCLDGWIYNIVDRDSIVTEVRPEATPPCASRELPHAWTGDQAGGLVFLGPGTGRGAGKEEGPGASTQKVPFLHIQGTTFSPQTAHSMAGAVPSSGVTKMFHSCPHGVHSPAGVTSISESTTLRRVKLQLPSTEGWGLGLTGHP